MTFSFFCDGLILQKITDRIMAMYPKIKKYENKQIIITTFRNVYSKYWIDESFEKLSKIQIKNLHTEKEIISYIDQSNKYDCRLHNCEIFNKLTDFIIVRLAADFYGKDIDEYIADVDRITNINFNEPNYTITQKNTLLKITKGLNVLHVSICFYYLQLYNIIGYYSYDKCQILITSIINLVISKISITDLKSLENEHSIFKDYFGALGITEKKYLQRLHELYILFYPAAKEYGHRDIKLSKFELTKIFDLLDYQFLCPHSKTRIKFKQSFDASSIICYILSFFLIDRENNKVLVINKDNINHSKITLVV